MSSSTKRDIQRKLERDSTPRHTLTRFPEVNSEGYLRIETRLSPSSISVPPSPRSQKRGRADRIFDGNEYGKLRRRPSIEARTRNDEYHRLLEGGNLWSDDEIIDDVDTDAQKSVQSEPAKEDSSSIQQSHLAPTTNASAEIPRPSMVSVLCGRQDPNSWYLTRRLVRWPSDRVLTDVDTSTLLKWRNVDPDAAELHRLWRRTGVIPTRYRDVNFDPDGIDPQHTWIACWPLLNAAIYGYMSKDVEFVDRVMDLLDDKVVKGVRPDAETISHIFGEKRQHIPVALGRFLVDRWVDAGPVGPGDGYSYDLPQLFVYAALETAMGRLSYAKQSLSLSSCQYHTHAKPEECYKRRNVGDEARRQERYKYRREKASRQAEQVAADSIECGIATVDWEERRIEEHRRLRSERDDSLLAAESWTESPGQKQEIVHLSGLELLDDAHEPKREAVPERYLNIRSSSSSMFGTAQAEGPVDEVKFAPPAREPPSPPSSPRTHVQHHHSTAEGDQYFEKKAASPNMALSVCGDAMLVVKIEQDSESISSGAPALSP